MRYLRTVGWMLLLGLSPFCGGNELLRGQHSGVSYVLEQLAEGLGVPWGMAFVGSNQLLVTERQGHVVLINTETGARSKVSGAPAVLASGLLASGQGGLLDVAVPPDYQPGGWIYFTYSKDVDGQGATTLARARLEGDQLRDWTDLLVTHSVTDTTRHFGSRIAFDNDGFVYFGVGDRGERPNGQDLMTHAGAVLRLHRDGRVPEDNPFIGRKDVLPEIWSYGHRNLQGLAFDQQHNRLWEIEHGPRGGDEINLIESGRNYGWPVSSFGKEYWGPISVGEGTHKAGMESPVKVYIPSIAPGSLLLYSGDAFPGWRGQLFAGALKLTHLNLIMLDTEGRAVAESRLFGELGERIRALAQSPEGWIYLSTDSGKILRIRPQ
ncbi:MAG: glucose/arabinose dehydrogenase [Motiliproteus sp.]|jgi:glucose/arabinose dehydrogenase